MVENRAARPRHHFALSARVQRDTGTRYPPGVQPLHACCGRAVVLGGVESRHRRLRIGGTQCRVQKRARWQPMWRPGWCCNEKQRPSPPWEPSVSDRIQARRQTCPRPAGVLLPRLSGPPHRELVLASGIGLASLPPAG